MKNRFKPGLCLILFMLSAAIWPQQSLPGLHINPEEQIIGISIVPELGKIKGASREIVYPGATWSYLNPYLSLLKWQIDELTLAGGTISFNYNNLLFLNAGYWTVLTFGKTGRMEDFDWHYKNLLQWTHYSNHDTYLEKGFLYDVSLVFMYYRTPPLSLGVMLGFKQKEFSWTDQTNYHIYTWVNQNSEYIEGVSNLHDVEETYPPGVEGVSYEVLYSTPYLGASLKYDLYPLSIQTLLTYSLFTWVDDHDHHILRGLHFIDYFRFCQTLGVGIETKFFLLPRLYINLKADYFYVLETSGTVYHADTNWKPIGKTENGGGIQFTTYSLTSALGFQIY